MIGTDFPIACEPFQPRDLIFKIADTRSEIEQFWDLRRSIFCEEQGVFVNSDRDEHDGNALPIVCVALLAGMPDRVSGVVRIDEREPGVWWGSRLGVHREFRHLRRLSSSVSCRNYLPRGFARKSIGAGLIFTAVSTANGLGCTRFLATVQHQNAAFFQRLHWRPLGELELHGIRHVHMEAELDYYPAASPCSESPHRVA